MRMILSAAVLGLAVSGCGGGGGGAEGTSVPSVTSGAPKLVQTQQFQTPSSNTASSISAQFTSATAAGDAIWVALTVPDFGGTHTISVTDTQGNIYTQLDQEDDGPPGSQSVAHFYAAHIQGDSTTADTVTVNAGVDNYQGMLIAEISGVTQAPLVGHVGNIQDGLPKGTDNVSAGAVPVSAAQTPALVLTLSMNTSGGASDIGGSGFPGPAAGTGLTQNLALWNWGTTLATFATATVTTAESFTSVFSAPDTDSFVTVAAVFH